MLHRGNRPTTTKQARETEAEAVASVVAKATDLSPGAKGSDR